MSRRVHEKIALDIVAGRTGAAKQVPKDKASPMTLLSIGLWSAAIIGIGLVATYFYRQ